MDINSPGTYEHSELPYGRDLQGEPLQKALIELNSEYTNDVVVNKLSRFNKMNL